MRNCIERAVSANLGANLVLGIVSQKRCESGASCSSFHICTVYFIYIHLLVIGLASDLLFKNTNVGNMDHVE